MVDEKSVKGKHFFELRVVTSNDNLYFFKHLYRIVVVRRSVFSYNQNKRSVLIFHVVHDDRKLQHKITPKKHIH